VAALKWGLFALKNSRLVTVNADPVASAVVVMRLSILLRNPHRARNASRDSEVPYQPITVERAMQDGIARYRGQYY